ncbi:MAG: amino acid adenylation domain-containing protein [Polyangiaceae bacterium]|nr:amino acid adenylation domain-containing protein [Polyangiaceae bacterium]
MIGIERAQRFYLLERLGMVPGAMIVARAAATGQNVQPTQLVERLRITLEAAGLHTVRFDSGAAAWVSCAHIVTIDVVETSGGTADALKGWVAALPAFDLQKGLNVRAAVVVGRGETACVIAAHRAIADASLLDKMLVAAVGDTNLSLVKQTVLPNASGDAAEYAKRCFSGLDEPTELMGDCARPQVFVGRARSSTPALSTHTVELAKAVANRVGVGVEAVFLAAFSTLVSRSVRKSDLVLGRRVAGANAGAAGAPDNDVFFRASLTPGLTVETHIRQTWEGIQSGNAHALVPIESVISALNPPRDASRPALYQLAFHLRNRAAFPGGWEPMDVPRFGCTLDLEVEVEVCVHTNRARITVVENSDIFTDEGRAPRMVGHLTYLIEQFASNVDAVVTSLPLVRGDERRSLVFGDNVRETFSTEDTLADRVARAAKLRPNAIALTSGSEQVTYRELEERATKLARELRRRGVKPGERVGIVMERTPRLVVALYAILKAGGAYVPVEPTQPTERIFLILGDTDPRLVLTDSASIGVLPKLDAEFVAVDQLEKELTSAPATELEPAAVENGSRADSLAYIIYTSGSTGRPKGCALRHREVVRLFDATEQWYHFGPSDVWTFFHSVAFDFSVWEIWGALMFGGRLVVVPYNVTRSPEDFRRLVGAEKVTILNQTPSAFRQFVDADALVGESLPALREVIFGGEALDLESLRPFWDRHGDKQPRLVNMYGITETTVFVTYRPLSRADLESRATSNIGIPIADMGVYIVDEHLQLVPVGVPGELIVAAAGVSLGYWKRPELTAERFLPDPFEPSRGLIYRSGDLVKRLPTGEIDYLGRIDQQVKIRGYRIEIGEVEAAIRKTGLVRDVVVLAVKKTARESVLAAYVVTDASTHDLRAALKTYLPGYMVPSVFVRLESIPINENGKVDRKALPDPLREATDENAAKAVEPPRGRWEEAVVAAFEFVLGRTHISVTAHFFDEGGTSLGAVQLAHRLTESLGFHVPVVKVFEYPTAAALAEWLEQKDARVESVQVDATQNLPTESRDRDADVESDGVAIIGASGRFPGAATVDAFWENLLAGKESIHFFGPGELSPALDPELTARPDYVAARGLIDGPADFDAPFFGMSTREAEITDPQQRLALTLAWEAFESAGVDPTAYPGSIGVYAGEHAVTYYTQHLLPRRDVVAKTGEFLAMLGNEKDYVAMRIAYKLDLRGPALSIHTACSTSLVAVANAFHALRSGQIDMALAGGVSLTHPAQSGYVYQEEAISSPDGHTRPFDEKGKGTVFSDGGAFVVLKRLKDAVRDGDHIVAVIRGAATNNDGARRMSFMAPTPSGQTAVIKQALSNAGVHANSIGYVEAHGTATPIGDPIEVDALKQAFGPQVDTAGCVLGSVKSNVGHLAAAAGAVGLIKASYVVQHGVIPPTLHFDKPNPKLDLESSPFVVSNRTLPFPADKRPRRAGVSSFGVGGTNAHVIVEEPPPRPTHPSARENQLFVLSARTESALSRSAENLGKHLANTAFDHPSNMADCAYTLALGRKPFDLRRFAVAKSAEEARSQLAEKTSAIAARARCDVTFAFPGQGAQYLTMGSALAKQEKVFREAMDTCLALLTSGKNGPGGPLLCDLSDVFSLAGSGENAALVDTAKVQPALFVVEWALAQLWMSLGIKPRVMVGHSIGEIVAAALAGVFDLESALRFVYHRGRLMRSAPPGGMLSVRASENDIADELKALGSTQVGISVVNAPKLVVVGGPDEDLTRLAEQLARRDIATSRLRVSHAFHSPMMDGVLGELRSIAAEIQLRAPTMEIISTVTGQTLSAEEAQSPDYWSRHVRETVRFSDALSLAWERFPNHVLIEVGPRATLSTLSKQIAPQPKEQVSIPSLEPRPSESAVGFDEGAAFLRAVGQAWSRGAPIDWKRFYQDEKRLRVALPTYPFELKTYLIEPPPFNRSATGTTAPDVAKSAEAAAAQPAAEKAPLDRRSALTEAVRAVFEEASGMDVSEPGVTFMEFGLDSLSLTQCAQLLSRRVGGDITFRQIVEELYTLDKVVDYLEKALPEGGNAGAPATVQKPSAPTPAAAQPDAEAPPQKTFGAGARIERVGTSLPEQQEKALADFMKAYVARTPKSKEYAAQNRSIVADPRVVTGFKPMWKEVVYPIVVDRSEGPHLWDIDGNKWIDLTCGFGANFFGHRPPYVVQAVEEQLKKGFEIGPQHPLVGECAKLVVDLTGHERVVFCNTGSEAILGATRIARTVTNRPMIVSFSGDYHGILDEVILRGTKSLRSIPGAPGILPSAVQHNLVLDYGETSALEVIRQRAADIAAVVVEPVQSRRPDLQPRLFLKELRALTKELGIALVFDEIITGFRLCPGGAQEYFGIEADIATYGKILGGGLPIGAIAGCRRFMDALDGGSWQYGDASVPEVGVTYFAGTFVRHPLALAACKASLEYVKQAGPELQSEVTLRTAKLVGAINADLKRAEAPYSLTTCGSWFKLNYADDLPFGGLLFFWLRLKGLHIWDGRVAFLTTTHTDEDCAAIREAFASSIREMQEAGFLPTPKRSDSFAVRPAAGARIGKDESGNPAWFIPDPNRPGQYLKYLTSGKTSHDLTV